MADQLDEDFVEQKENLSQDQLLQKVPEKIIDPQGQIVEIRKGIQEQFSNKNLKERFLDEDFSQTLRVQANSQRIQLNEAVGEDCKLKVRSSLHIFYVSLSKKEPLRVLYRLIAKKVQGSFLLEKNYPKELLDIKTQGEKSMEELGLYPEYALNLVFN